MTEQPALIIALDDQGIRVRIQPHTTACTFCTGGCNFNRLFSLEKKYSCDVYIKKNRITPERNQTLHTIRTGEQVFLGMRNSQLLAGSMIVYLMPLLMFFIAIQTAKIAFANELFTIFAGVFGLLFGFLGLRLLDRSRYSGWWSVTLRRSGNNAETSLINSY